MNLLLGLKNNSFESFIRDKTVKFEPDFKLEKVVPDKKRANPRTTKYNNFKNHFATHILGLDEPEAPTNGESGRGVVKERDVASIWRVLNRNKSENNDTVQTEGTSKDNT